MSYYLVKLHSHDSFSSSSAGDRTHCSTFSFLDESTWQTSRDISVVRRTAKTRKPQRKPQDPTPRARARVHHGLPDDEESRRSRPSRSTGDSLGPFPRLRVVVARATSMTTSMTRPIRRYKTSRGVDREQPLVVRLGIVAGGREGNSYTRPGHAPSASFLPPHRRPVVVLADYT